MITTRKIQDPEELDLALMHMNEVGVHPSLPFIDADGVPGVYHGTVPGPEMWFVALDVHPDTDVRWRPRFPITVMEVDQPCLCPPPATPSGPNCARCGHSLPEQEIIAAELLSVSLLADGSSSSRIRATREDGTTFEFTQVRANGWVVKL